MRLAGKRALVTGAGRGLGKAIALEFARQGASVVAADRDPDWAQSTAQEVVALGREALAVQVDVGVEAEVDAMVGAALTRFGGIDILVANAGVGFHRALLDLKLEDWERVLRVNLTGVFLSVQRTARAMVEKGNPGAIIIIGSTSGQRGAMARCAYGASKAGVMQLARVAAAELAPFRIRVNSIAPGPIVTPLTSGPKGHHTEGQKNAYLERIPMRRYGEAQEVANAAVFLASEEASFTTGHTLNVDGGLDSAGLMFSLDEARSYASRKPGEDPR